MTLLPEFMTFVNELDEKLAKEDELLSKTVLSRPLPNQASGSHPYID